MRLLVTLVELVALTAAVAGSGYGAAFADESAPNRWVARMTFSPPQVNTSGICAGQIGALPEFDVSPAHPGKQLVRVPVPFAPGTMPADLGVKAVYEGHEYPADFRVLTLHPGLPASVRRAIVTFPFDFKVARTYHFTLALTQKAKAVAPTVTQSDGRYAVEFAGMRVVVSPDTVEFTSKDGTKWTATTIAPARAQKLAATPEVVEAGQYYLWMRLLVPDSAWPRTIEVRLDNLGTIAVELHLQRDAKGDGTAPDLGWEIKGPAMSPVVKHTFTDGTPCTLRSQNGAQEVTFPIAPYLRRGYVTVAPDAHGAVIRYLRCTADEKVPYQQAAWRRAAFTVGPAGLAERTPLLEPTLHWKINAKALDAVYGMKESLDLSRWPVLNDLRRFTREAIKDSALVGDDFGNVTDYQPGAPAPVFGMNRLNHCPAIFDEAWRSGDPGLREVALNWCNNMYDLSIWWGDTPTYGGTRYNNAVAADQPEHKGDKSFMWRTNEASTFCTKGYDSFFYAYEETGDPRMLTALNAQVAYTHKYVHADTGECRNIGDVADFMTLYHCTGVKAYLDDALRLFRELRTKLSTGDLFSQGGQPIVANGPFIDDDEHGYKAPFAKPYILGYALAGLPDLLQAFPNEPKLHDVVRAVADFMVKSQDPVGGWRYPHPRSSWVIINQAMEHAAQLAKASALLAKRGEPIEKQLDAIERVLQARTLGFARTGEVLAGLGGWEEAAGILKNGKTIYDLYKKPGDRDPSRDYTEGAVSVGGSPPEGLVYLSQVLRFYLAHRPAERLFHADQQLREVLARTEDRRIKLIPQAEGAVLRVERPDNKNIGFTLLAPQSCSFPKLGDKPDALKEMKLDWKSDPETGAVWCTIDRPDGTLTATFTPHVDYVECAYTVWPKLGAEVVPTVSLTPCAELKQGVFDGPDWLKRVCFVSGGEAKTLDSCAAGNARNVLCVAGHDSPEQSGPEADSGWKTIQASQPDNGLIACASQDGQWIAGLAAENATRLAADADAAARTMASETTVPLRKDGPTTLRVNVYLVRGGFADIRARYQADAARWKAQPASPGMGETRFAQYGMRAGLPSDHEARLARLHFPLAWPDQGEPFAVWRARARKAYLAALSVPPVQAPFAPHVVATEDRGSYVAEKISFNISADNRIGAYLLVPKGKGPFPAILALHDHGAHFSIGKEKVVRPFGVSAARMKDAQDWVNECYGGKWIGDELAQRGYVVLAIDALFWGDRGRAEGVKFEAQERLAANMFQLGATWAGTIVWDDLRSAQFLQGLPDVIPSRIGCVGLSLGSHRSWSLAAATDIIKAGVAICWMGDTASLMSEGNNQTTGQSAFSMIHPGLRNLLDYPDVASIACPKPMLFFNGSKDSLFPLPGVKAAYARMRRVWDSQGADDKLVTKIWPVPHVFNVEMQKEAFDWLDKQLKS